MFLLKRTHHWRAHLHHRSHHHFPPFHPGSPWLPPIFATLVLALSGCSRGVDDGLTKYPVHGQVLINGDPAEGVAVNFNNTDPKVPGNAARPVAVTDPDGRYTLSTNAEKDGAVEGEYVVTFFWPSDDGPMPLDRLKSRFSDAARSAHKVRVEPKENDITPFRLEMNPKQILPPSPSK